jgi:hypothetical protein
MSSIVGPAIASKTISRRRGRIRFLCLGATGLAVAIGVAAMASAATAATTTGPEMSIGFPSRTASVAGPGALVSVKCTGSADRACTGTLTVEGLSESHSVSYAVARGERRSLVVPLGTERSFFDGIASPKMKVVAETVQPTGSSVRTARLLRFK